MVAAGFERASLSQFLRAPLPVIKEGEGGDGRREFGPASVGVPVDDLLVEGEVEAFDHAVGFWLADEAEARGEVVQAALPLEAV